MKFGVRTPNVKKSIKARTTGRTKRALKSSINPTYGKKGIGYINNPKKAVYNKIYNKVSIDPLNSTKNNSTNKVKIDGNTYNLNIKIKEDNLTSNNVDNLLERKKVNKWISFILCLYLGYFGAHKFYEGNSKLGIVYLCTLGLFGIGWIIDIVSILLKPNPYYVEVV